MRAPDSGSMRAPDSGSVRVLDAASDDAGATRPREEAGVPLPACAQDATCVRVHLDEPLHEIPRLLFGENVEWAHAADGLWDAEAGRAHDDVVSVLAPLGISLLRFPGGTYSDFYHWREAIGSQRKPQINPFESDGLGGLANEYPHFGPDELPPLAKALGAELLITANAGTGSAEEAAAWLQHYKDNGVRAPYWEVGNEVWIQGDDLAATMQRKTPEQYAALFDSYARALRAVEPSVKVGAISCSNWLTTSLCADPRWNEVVFASVQERVDFVSVHDAYPLVSEHYDAARDELLARAVLAASADVEEHLQRVAKDIKSLMQPQNRAAKIALTEHASYYVPDIAGDPAWLDAVYRNRTLASALYEASLFHVLFRNANVALANHLPMISPAFQAPCSLSADNTQPLRSAYGHVLALYAQAGGSRLLRVDVANVGTFDGAATRFMPLRAAVPRVDVVSTLGADGHVRIYLVNRDLHAAANVSLRIEGGPAATQLEQTLLTAASYAAQNSTTTPTVVQPMSSSLEPQRALELSLPAASLTLLRFR
jgi:alpha-N-arabinofuranosidase